MLNHYKITNSDGAMSNLSVSISIGYKHSEIKWLQANLLIQADISIQLIKGNSMELQRFNGIDEKKLLLSKPTLS
jgi:hypothetical protein